MGIIVQSTRVVGMEKKTWAFLEELNIPCDDLRLGKPRGEFYIGGPNTIDGVLGDIEKQVGFVPTDVTARRVYKQAPISTKKAKITEVRALRPDSKGITCVVKLVGTLVEVEGKPGCP